MFSLFVALTGITQAQKNMHKVFGIDSKIITGSSKIIVYEIDPVPVLSVDQVQSKNYIYDYQILRSIVFRKKNAAGLIFGVMDSTQYLYGINKKCPFMGKYAVQFRKGIKAITMIISPGPCEKTIIFCPGSMIDKKHIDLIDQSKIVAALQKLLASQPEIKK